MTRASGSGASRRVHLARGVRYVARDRGLLDEWANPRALKARLRR